MKKTKLKLKSIIVLFSFFSLITLYSCTNSEINPKILNAYKEILIVRESEPDNNIANKEVVKILKKYNLSENEFRTEMFEIMKNNKEFVKMIDAVRNSVKNELENQKNNN